MPPKSIHDKFEELFREYIVVGGMPRVVADYIENKDFRRVDDIQKTIIKDYEYDISKHAKGAEKVKVRACYKSIPMQLAKEHTKFQYSVVETGQTKKKYGNSITWLIDSNLVNVCYNVSEPYMPLLGNSKEDYFKLYLNDTGLLCAMFGHKTKLSILNNTIIGNAKGGIYENIIAECLAKKGHTLYFSA